MYWRYYNVSRRYLGSILYGKTNFRRVEGPWEPAKKLARTSQKRFRRSSMSLS